ncbi:uncharacterized protein LOC132195559 isoform X2 [Neocloeon triangulifer]|uniref:uncharacterized protein LOC132195559 isoform X2 n=1 Tax=Neocloeon triangulifer TaxID=2078957 RepID=UPI00286F0C9B|nr:uncharacterized protein LOC132195559 isoform X2 [Neocloeon triangulifer]
MIAATQNLFTLLLILETLYFSASGYNRTKLPLCPLVEDNCYLQPSILCFCKSTGKDTLLERNARTGFLNLYDSTNGALICPRKKRDECSKRCNLRGKCLSKFRKDTCASILGITIIGEPISPNGAGLRPDVCPTDLTKCHHCGSTLPCYCPTLQKNISIRCSYLGFLDLFDPNSGLPYCMTSNVTTDCSKIWFSKIAWCQDLFFDSHLFTPLNNGVANSTPWTILSTSNNNVNIAENPVSDSVTEEHPIDKGNMMIYIGAAIGILVTGAAVSVAYFMWRKRKRSAENEQTMEEENEMYGVFPGRNMTAPIINVTSTKEQERVTQPIINNEFEEENELYGTFN